MPCWWLGHGVNLAFLLQHPGGALQPAMARLEHYWHRRQLGVRQDLSGHGDRAIIESTVGGDSRYGTYSFFQRV